MSEERKKWLIEEMAQRLEADFDNRSQWPWAEVADKLFAELTSSGALHHSRGGAHLTPTIVGQMFGRSPATAMGLLRGLCQAKAPYLKRLPGHRYIVPKGSPWIYLQWQWQQQQQQQNEQPTQSVTLKSLAAEVAELRAMVMQMRDGGAV